MAAIALLLAEGSTKVGISISVALYPDRVSDAQWARVYDETCAVLASWPDAPLGVGERTVAGESVRVWSRTWKHTSCWQVVGDARSRMTAEGQLLWDRLPRDGSPLDWVGSKKPPLDPTDRVGASCKDDILAAYAYTTTSGNWQCLPAPGAVTLLGNKTQGEPFHTLIAAVAILIENRFPHTALALGDIDADDAKTALDHLKRISSEELAPPAILDEQRVRSRLQSLLPPEMIEKFVAEHFAPRSEHIADLCAAILDRPSVRLKKELQRSAGCTDARSISPALRETLLDAA